MINCVCSWGWFFFFFHFSTATTSRRKGGHPPSGARAKRALFKANRTLTLKEDYKETLLKLQEKNKLILSNTNTNIATNTNNLNTKGRSPTITEPLSPKKGTNDASNIEDHKVLRRIQSQVNVWIIQYMYFEYVISNQTNWILCSSAYGCSRSQFKSWNRS